MEGANIDIHFVRQYLVENFISLGWCSKDVSQLMLIVSFPNIHIMHHNLIIMQIVIGR
jgi:hypothetical protein